MSILFHFCAALKTSENENDNGFKMRLQLRRRYRSWFRDDNNHWLLLQLLWNRLTANLVNSYFTSKYWKSNTERIFFLYKDKKLVVKTIRANETPLLFMIQITTEENTSPFLPEKSCPKLSATWKQRI